VSEIPKETFFNLKEDKQQRIIDASIDEFAERSFENAMVSNIIKNSKIPRGSFYQYFEDKMDLYKYVFSKVAEKKLEYMGDLIPNPKEIPFLDLFLEMYKKGAMFAHENPRLVKITSHLVSNGGVAYEEIMKNNLQMAHDFYIGYIESDKALGRIDKNVDSSVLANLVIDMTTNTALGEIKKGGAIDDLDSMIKNIENIIYIFKKGIETGE